MMKLPRLLLGSAALCLGLAAFAAPTDPLQSGFLNPPASAKPQTWWHWMNGSITKEGITADLEAMKQIGLGGATIVNVDCGIPRGRVAFMSPEWRADFKFAVQEANRLGLKLCVENCAGWSSSGGPWNTVTNAMQRLTSSETRAQGPVVFDAVLPQPPVTLGFYRDIAVLAFKAPPVEGDTASSTAPSAAKLEIKRAVFEAKDGGGSADVTAKVVALIKSGQESVVANSDELGGDPAFGQVKQLRVEFTLDGKPGTMTVDEGETLIFPVNAGQLAVARLLEKTPVDRTFVRPPPAIAAAASEAIPRDSIVDLTAKLAADGRLRWDVPPGSWIILRLGYTPTGVNNHPAPKEGTGLECDKFSKAALDAHWDGFMQKVLDDLGPLAGQTLDSSLIDSYEVGGQDWTANFREEFQKRRGYDPLKFLPAFARHVVDNPAATERFLWDMRRTFADLFAQNYYGHFAELCRQHGLMSAMEPYTGPFESLQCGAPADVVMGEFWSGSQGHPSVKLAASIAHIYGKTIVGAESFTADPENGRWQNDPYSLKTLGDLMYCQGINRYYFHRYAMQPWTNRWPGMTMGQYGFHFERTVTWWAQGKSWIDYISHCEFLLQQGRAVADAAYFTGESAPVEMRVGNPALPLGYDYDAINAGVLDNATVKNGRITLASGANYAALILPPTDVDMTPQTLQRIRELVRAGATVVGPRPQHSPSLADFPKCDAQVKKIVDELWGQCDGTSVLENSAGNGRIVWGESLVDVFASQNLKPDFDFQGADANTRLAYVHRVADVADIYFVSNQRRQFDSAECTFRVGGKIPELWHPDTGVIEPAPVWSAPDGRTKVRLNFDPAGSVFVIFRHAADGEDHVVAASGNFIIEPSTAPKLEIQHAVYAATDGAGAMDVTAKISELARAGRLVVAANNDVLGHDPTPNHEKELRVDYTLDGKPGHATVHENETLTLPVAATVGQSPPWETSAGNNGSPVVKMWRNGRVELQTANGRAFRAEATNLPAPQEITGAWKLDFPPNWGAPPSVSLEKLISWTDHTNDGVRFFSGTASYEKEIEVSAERLTTGRELWLDLGAVENFAEVSLNDQNLGVLWKPPFVVNVTAAAKPGVNRLVVKVTNLWPNRLIGDEQLPPDCEWNGNQLKAWPRWLLDGQPSPTDRLAFATWHHWTKDAPLLESGLLGPVTLRTSELIPASASTLVATFDPAKANATSRAGLYNDPTNGLGSWIWAAKVFDNQTCLLWKSFEIPPSTRVRQARLCMTVDNEFTVFLDGRELGHGADYPELFDFDLTPLLRPGRHVLAVKAFNSYSFAGMILGLQIDLADGRYIEIKSDQSWRVVPNGTKDWEKMTEAAADWPAATVEAPLGGGPWWTKPLNVVIMPTLQPIKVFFWQTGWFQITLLVVCGLVILISLRLMAQLALHQKERWLLQQERARIARDIHDDIGSRMTQLVLHGEVAQSDLPDDSKMRPQLDRICEEARGLLSSMDEILWAVNPRRDTLRDFASYVCDYAQKFLISTQIQCLFEVDPEMSAAAFDLPLRRSLLMAIKETLNNAVKHSKATELQLKIYWQGQQLVVVVQDNGKGFDMANVKSGRNGLANIAQRMNEMGGRCGVTSQPGQGCRIEFGVPLTRHRRHPLTWLWNSKRFSRQVNEPKNLPPNDPAQIHDPTKC